MINKPYYWDKHKNRWIVETTYRNFEFNVEDHAFNFVLLYNAGLK